MKRAIFPVDWKSIRADYSLPAGIDIARRLTVFYAKQLPSVEV